MQGFTEQASAQYVFAGQSFDCVQGTVHTATPSRHLPLAHWSSCVHCSLSSQPAVSPHFPTWFEPWKQQCALEQSASLSHALPLGVASTGSADSLSSLTV